MKKLLAIFVACLMVLSCVSAMAFSVSAETYELQGYRYANGMENWAGGTGGEQTQILYGLGYDPGSIADEAAALALVNSTTAVYTLSISTSADMSGAVDYVMPVSSWGGNLGPWALIRFEPCLAENQFIPEKDVVYYIDLTIVDGDKTYEFTGASEGYLLNVDPIVPKDWEVVGGVLTVYKDYEFATVEEYPWFAKQAEITKVVIAEGVTSVGKFAFTGTDAKTYYQGVTEVVISEGVTTLGQDAFSKLNGLKTITVPATVTTIGQGVVYNSGNITTVYGGWDTADEFKAVWNVKPYNDNFDREYLKIGSQPVAPEYPIAITIAPIFNAWENWINSPNNPNGVGEQPGVTQLLVEIKNAEGKFVNISADLTWKITITAADGTNKTITMSPGTIVSDYCLYRFETCLGEGENKFVPVNGTEYTITIEVFDGDELQYKSEPTAGFTCPMDPVDPNPATDDNTDNGNTDNGDNGNTDNGNTDNGNTDNGNTDNGTTDDTTTDDTTTDDTTTDTTDDTATEDEGGFPGWAIAVIIIAAVAVAGGVVFILKKKN